MVLEARIAIVVVSMKIIAFNVSSRNKKKESCKMIAIGQHNRHPLPYKNTQNTSKVDEENFFKITLMKSKTKS